MKKTTLRSLGLGFLSAAIFTSAFALLQGHVPIEGVTIDSVFNPVDADLITSLEENNQLLQSEIDQLESKRNNLNSTIASMNEKDETHKKEIKKLEETIESLKEAAESLSESEDLINESNTDTSEETTQSDSGEFVIQDGESSADISNRLEAEGIIDSATEFQELLDTWNLHSVIQTGSYELSKDMSIHEIAEIITEGAYLFN